MPIDFITFLQAKRTLLHCTQEGPLRDVYRRAWSGHGRIRTFDDDLYGTTPPETFDRLCNGESLLTQLGRAVIMNMDTHNAWSIGYNFIDHNFPVGTGAFRWAQSLLGLIAESHPPRGYLDLYPMYPWVIKGVDPEIENEWCTPPCGPGCHAEDDPSAGDDPVFEYAYDAFYAHRRGGPGPGYKGGQRGKLLTR